MNKLLKVTLLCAVLCSCAKNTPVPPRAISVPEIAPKVEKVEIQAKQASSQAEKTAILSDAIKQKYQGDAAIVELDAAVKKTSEEVKKTQFEVEFLKTYAQNADLKSTELFKESEAKDVYIAKAETESKKVKEELIQQKAKNTSKNGYIIALLSAAVLMAAIIIKPWRWL